MKRADWLAGRPQPELYRILELLVICFVWTTLSFVLPLMLPVACTEKPEGSEEDYEPAVGSLVDDLSNFSVAMVTITSWPPYSGKQRRHPASYFTFITVMVAMGVRLIGMY